MAAFLLILVIEMLLASSEECKNTTDVALDWWERDENAMHSIIMCNPDIIYDKSQFTDAGFEILVVKTIEQKIKILVLLTHKLMLFETQSETTNEETTQKLKVLKEMLKKETQTTHSEFIDKCKDERKIDVLKKDVLEFYKFFDKDLSSCKSDKRKTISYEEYALNYEKELNLRLFTHCISIFDYSCKDYMQKLSKQTSESLKVVLAYFNLECFDFNELMRKKIRGHKLPEAIGTKSDADIDALLKRLIYETFREAESTDTELAMGFDLKSFLDKELQDVKGSNLLAYIDNEHQEPSENILEVAAVTDKQIEKEDENQKIMHTDSDKCLKSKTQDVKVYDYDEASEVVCDNPKRTTGCYSLPKWLKKIIKK